MALTRGDRQKLERMPGGVHRTVTLGHEIGLTTRARNKRIADRTGLTQRSVRRHCAFARLATIHIPEAPPGRPLREDYTRSRRGHRTSRGTRRHDARTPHVDPLHRAAKAIARPGDDEGELVRVMRWIAEMWPASQHPGMNAGEAAAALRMYFEAGGRLGPEAEQWWRREVRSLSLDRAHTPWRAAASKLHLAPWLEHRRRRERVQRAELERDQRQERDEAHAASERPTPEQIEAMRIRALGRRR
jgi:hypothetical protein